MNLCNMELLLEKHLQMWSGSASIRLQCYLIPQPPFRLLLIKPGVLEKSAMGKAILICQLSMQIHP
ncbi:hypothetical protein SOVF_041110 [Spinacia oleracea]|nr:hypothetical protein SOVF_041110 [Spinacia oleracea]